MNTPSSSLMFINISACNGNTSFDVDKPIQSGLFIKKLEEITHYYSPFQCDIKVVRNVSEWKNANKVKDENFFRTAATVKSSGGRYIILINELITIDDYHRVFPILIAEHVVPSSFNLSLYEFFIHLFLHEVAHVLGRRTEKQADIWAMQELKKWT